MNENDGIRTRSSVVLSKGYAVTFLILAVIVYPLALLPQVLRIGDWANNLSFHISIPAFLILGLLAVPVVIAVRWRVPLSIGIGLGVFVLFWLINIPSIREYWDEFAALLGCITIPLVAAVLREKGVLTERNLAYAGLGLWIVQVGLGFISIARNQPVVGTPGNINWMAALLLILTPWSIAAFMDLLPARMSRLARVLVSLAVTAGPTLVLLYYCHSRAAWAALVLAPLALVFLVFKSRLEKLLYACLLFTVLAGSLMVGYRLIPGTLLRVVEQDVRLPLWTSTVRMMLRNPMGVGSGEFQRKFTPYRVESTYHARLYAADMTVHPHNEFLNISAQLGIPVFIALLLLVSPLIRGNFKSSLVNCARLSALFVVFQSCFDMPLVQPPVSFLGFFMIGLCWPLTLRKGQPLPPFQRMGALSTCVLMVGVAGYFTYHDLWSDIHMRKASLEKHVAQRTAQEGNKYRQNKEVFQRFQAQAGAHYNESRRLYEKAITPYCSLKAHYEAALVALNVQQKADDTQKLLGHIVAIDPDYAHINLLRGRLSLLSKDLQKANYYFTRECTFYPFNSDAWQTLYNFSFRSGQYNRCLEIQEQLVTIYSERARLTFPGRQLDGERKTYVDYVGNADKKAESIGRANAFMARVNQKTADPMFIDLAMNEEWPSKLLGNNFDELDYLYWTGRLEKWEQIKLHDLQGSIPKLADWFTKTFGPRDRPGFELPLTVAKNQRGNLISRYACFSEYVNIMGGQTVIELDDAGTPLHAWVFAGRIKREKVPSPNNPNISLIKLDFSKVSTYKFDLKKGELSQVDLVTIKDQFRWEKKRTVVFFSPEEYFMRTQILASMLGDDFPFLDKRPPSLRLLELFWISGQEPPVPTEIHQHCFEPVLELYKGFYEKARATIEGGAK